MRRSLWNRHTAAAVLLCAAWQVAGATTLLEYYDKALQRDPDFAAARASFETDIRSRELARSAFMPSLNLSANADRTPPTRTPPVTRATRPAV